MADLDLGGALRRLRRVADLSQRELAAKAGVPPSTVARIESGEVSDPRFRTIEKLARAAGGTVSVVVVDDPHALTTAVGPDELVTDAAARRYPAHLDVRETYPVIDETSRLLTPGTVVRRYERFRLLRDDRRGRMAPAAKVEVIGGEAASEMAWEWTARDGDDVVGELRAWVWPQQVTVIERLREVVFCELAVHHAWRRMGIEQRLLRRLRAVVAEHDFAFAVTLGYARSDVPYLRSFGFHPMVRWVVPMRLAGDQ